MTDIPRVRWRRRPGALAALADAGEPVILEGALSAWRTLSPPLPLRRLLAELRRRAGHRTLMTSRAPRRARGLLSYRGRGGTGRSWRDLQETFAAFLAAAQRAATTTSGPLCYLQSATLTRELPELAPLFPTPVLAPPEHALLRQDSPRLWIGSGGHRVGLHYDTDHNFHCVVAGKKRFTILPPTAIPHVYLGALDGTPGGAPTALVDPLAPDLARFPRYAEVADRTRRAELGPGDVLFLPAYWLHHVESFDLNIALTYWWSDLPAAQRDAADGVLAHGLLELRELPPRWRAIYELLFDTFVWRRHGDPYAHLPLEHQGRFGAPTPARTRALRAQLRHQLMASHALEQPFDPEAPHALAPGLAFHVAGADQLEVAVPGGAPVDVPLPLFEILRAFHAPVAPAVVGAQRYRRDRAARAKFLELCHALVRRGVLRRIPGEAAG